MDGARQTSNPKRRPDRLALLTLSGHIYDVLNPDVLQPKPAHLRPKYPLTHQSFILESSR